MSIIKRLYYKWRRYKMRKKAQNELSKQMFNDPIVYEHKAKEINCIIYGHKWSTDFDAKNELSKPTANRVYCKNCGVYYHRHIYHE